MGPFPIELQIENRAVSLQPRGARLGDIALATLGDKETAPENRCCLELEMGPLPDLCRICSRLRLSKLSNPRPASSFAVLAEGDFSAKSPSCSRRDSSFPHYSGSNGVPSCKSIARQGCVHRLYVMKGHLIGTPSLHGARDGTRTHDLLITNQLRYQLRHSSGYGIVSLRRSALYTAPSRAIGVPPKASCSLRQAPATGSGMIGQP